LLSVDGEPYLLPHDADVRDLRNTGVSLRELMDWVEAEVRPAEALLVLDTSFAPPSSPAPPGFRNKAAPGPAMMSRIQAQQQMLKGTSYIVEPAVSLEEAVSAPANWAVVVAGVQQALEPIRDENSTEPLVNSVFTHYFLETLRDLNRDGGVTSADVARRPVALDLFDVFERTDAKVRGQSGDRQRVYLSANLRRPFTFQYMPAGELYRKARSILDQYTRPRSFIELTPDGATRVRQILEKANDLEDQQPVTLSWLGYLDSIEGQFAAADQRFTNAMALARSSREHASLSNLWAGTYVRRGNYLRASELYIDAWTLDPTNKVARVEGAYNLARGGRPAQALQSLESFSKDPMMSEEPSALASVTLRIGDVHLQAGDFAKAVEHYRAAVTQGTPTEIVADRLAWAAFANRRWAFAEQAALSSYPAETSLLLLRFFALRFSGKEDDAKALLQGRTKSSEPLPTERIIAYVAGDISYDTMMAELGPQPVLQCKAKFYAAMKAIADGRQDEGAVWLEQVLQTNMRHTPEWVAAYMMRSAGDIPTLSR